MLGDRNSPVYPRTLQPWMMCPAATRTPEAAASLVAAAGFWSHLPAVRSTQVGFALVSPARNRADTIPPPKRY